MRAVTGIFQRGREARQAAEAALPFVSKDRLFVLTPTTTEDELQQVPTEEDMGPVTGGMSAALGAALGVGLGLTIPGVGVVTVVGAAAAALLGAGGGVAGYAVGEAVDRAAATGIPVDDLYVYEDALRKGRSVVIVLCEAGGCERGVKDVMQRFGAEDIDAARRSWWVGIRDDLKLAYKAPGGADLTEAEDVVRAGCEAALKPRLRGRGYDDARDDLARLHPDTFDTPAFRVGYEHGCKVRQRRPARRRAPGSPPRKQSS